MRDPAGRRTVLFICTGNFYRSRFAEHLFNAIAHERDLAWTAVSRGTDAANALHHFPGQPMSAAAQQALDALGVEFRSGLRDPLQLTHDDLTAADLAIAVCEAEHRPHIERDFLAVSARVQYWGVHDVHVTPATDGLAAIQEHVRRLAERLLLEAEAEGNAAKKGRPPTVS